MKLATLQDGSRDGQLLVVSRDLALAHHASHIAGTLQRALDDWNFVSPQLQDLYATLNGGKARHAFAFEPRACMAPLPRAPQWLDGSAFLHHVQLVRRARGAEMPASLLEDPLMYQGGSDALLGPEDDAVFDFGTAADAAPHAADAAPGDGGADPASSPAADPGVDFESELAVVTGDVAMGTPADVALESVRLVLLANDWTLRNLVPAELAKGFGFVQAKPATAFSPVAVTPDELGEAWAGGRVHGVLDTHLNGRRVGHARTGPEMHFHFGALIAHAARTRRLGAGTLVGSGTVSNADRASGYGCIAEQRAHEMLEGGAARTRWLRPGDRVRIEMTGSDGQSVFGAIDQRVVALARGA